MFGCMAGGIKLPTFVVWKGFPSGRIDQQMRGASCPHNDIMYTFNQGVGWALQCTRSEYLQCCFLTTATKKMNYLLQVHCSVHLKEENIGMEVDFIPTGYTACFQVIDKRLNLHFKQYLRRKV